MPDRWVVDANHPEGHLVPMTPGEEAQLAADRQAGAAQHAEQTLNEGNAQTLRDKARQALDANAAFLAKPTPTQAETLAHVRTLTRESTALIRLLLGALDSTDGT